MASSLGKGSNYNGGGTTSMNNNPTPHLDFEDLLSREYRASETVVIRPREKFHPLDASEKKKKRARAAEKHNKNVEADEQEEDQARQREIVLRLVMQTPAFRQHLSTEERVKVAADTDDLVVPTPALSHPSTSLVPSSSSASQPSLLSLSLLTDWESQINWEGVPESSDNTDDGVDTLYRQTEAEIIQQAKAVLSKPRNPFLDNLVLDESTVSYDADSFRAKAGKVPLILQMGVAGQSVADKVYLGLSSQRPLPATQEAAYQARVERENQTSNATVSAADATNARGSLRQDKQKLEAYIAQRQEKRAKMAVEKKNRIAKAMDALHLGGGRARTITSSLMGPGGTERTGRPSRSMAGAYLEAEYLEQLDMIQNHSLVRDLSRILLREFHRPKLPYSVVRPDLSWQLQIRYTPVKKDATTNSFISGGREQLARAKFRTEADLSPSEGKLVVLEYCEERPPIQLVKGMRAKIVNYYRGDKAHCPVSAGGGDRPARKKRSDESAAKGDALLGRLDRLPRLHGPDRDTNVLDWIGKLPNKSKEKRNEEDAIDVLPEGVTEIVYPKSHGPFIGEIDEGMTISALVSNMFVAPIFRHEPEPSDFLMVLTPPGGAARSGMRDGMGVILRDFPKSVFTVGQLEPRMRVLPPGSPDERKFLFPYISYQIARALGRSMVRDGVGLKLDELQDRVFPNAEITSTTLRQRLKTVAAYDKNTGIWTPKQIGEDGYRGVEQLSREVSPEAIVAYQTASAAVRRLTDLGIHTLYIGDKTTASLGIAMTYLSGQMVSARKLMNLLKTAAGARAKRGNNKLQDDYYEKALAELQLHYKILKEKHDVAQFVYEELQLAPWHLTGEFVDVHKKSEGSGMMQLSGLGDPSGCGEGFSFLRKLDNRPAKAAAAGNSGLNAHVKKITGTEDDLRKLNMKEMEEILRKFGNMDTKQIKALKRWDRVHVIREISTRAASDRVGVGLERFARDEKFKLSEQKKDYRKKIQTIWKRQIAALSVDASDKGGDADGIEGMGDAENRASQDHKKSDEKDDSDEDSDSDDDDLVNELLEEMADGPTTGGVNVSLNAGDGDEKEKRELAKFLDGEKAAKDDFMANNVSEGKQFAPFSGITDRKVVRRKTTKTLPDGTQTTTFKFVCIPQEVGKLMANLRNDSKQRQEMKYQHRDNEKPPGHAMFEDQDSFDYSGKGRLSAKKRAAARRRPGERGPSRARGALQFSKAKQKVTKGGQRKRPRDEDDDVEAYNALHSKKSTNNRRERGSIRNRAPHVIFAERLEEIRSKAEARPGAGPFLKPVNPKLIPRYYEVIHQPIDLQTIRNKIMGFQYRKADSLMKDFELMKNNAIKFNLASSPIAQEAVAMYEMVCQQVMGNRAELTKLEEQVEDQFGGNSKKKRKLADGSGTGGGDDISDLIGDLRGYDSASGDEAEAMPVGSS